MKNRWLSVLLSLALLLTLLPVGALAAPVTGDCSADGSSVTWSYENGTLTIAGDGEMKAFDDTDEITWKAYTAEITKVVIEDGVTYVGSRSFVDCTALAEVSLGKDVAGIGERAFSGCTRLKHVCFPGKQAEYNTILIGPYNDALDNTYLHLGVSTLEGHAVGPESSPATCLDPAKDVYRCACGYLWEEITGPARGHDYAGVITAPDCVNGGYTTYTCVRCGDSYIGDEVPANGHDTYEDPVPESCEPGYIMLRCHNCDYAERKPNSEFGTGTGHDWAEPTYEWSENLASCTATRICRNDPTHIQTETVFAESKPTQSASCTVAAQTTYTAHFTNEAFQPQTLIVDTEDALGHDWGEWEVIKKPTCTTTGLKTRTCLRCGVKAAPSGIDEIGHDWYPVTYQWAVDYSTCTATRICANDKNHVEIETVPTATRIIDPTCLDGGITVYVAVFANEAFGTKEKPIVDVEPLGHDYVWTVTQKATCTEPAVETAVCSRCGDTWNRKTGEPNGHYFDIQDRPATCTEPGGVYHICINCDYYYITDEVDALDHDWQLWQVVTPATCEEDAVTLEKCSRCGALRDGTLPTEGHDWERIAHVDATCTESGYDRYECSLCHSTKDEPINALGHDWSAWATLVEKTCTTDGVRIRTCGRCQEEDRMTLPAGHSYEDGVCTVCGKYDPSMMKYSDVTENDYFYEALLWAVIYGIPDSNTGVFGVNVGSTRAEVVTYLWRASGCPSPKSYNGVFTDISSTAYYFKAVQWAVEQGITAGTGGYEFSPSRICTRAEVVALLWRAAGRPSIADLNMKERKRLAIISFEDVNADAYYFEAVQWAIAKGITAGTDATHFSPDLNCTRSQIVMFLYADLG